MKTISFEVPVELWGIVLPQSPMAEVVLILSYIAEGTFFDDLLKKCHMRKDDLQKFIEHLKKDGTVKEKDFRYNLTPVGEKNLESIKTAYLFEQTGSIK